METQAEWLMFIKLTSWVFELSSEFFSGEFIALPLLLRTSHNKCSHDVTAAGHSCFDEGCETSTILYLCFYTRKVV